MRISLIALGWVALLTGCAGASARFVQTAGRPHTTQARRSDLVELWDGKQPTRPYVEIGYVESWTRPGFREPAPYQLIDKMRVAAGKAGCDGLIMDDWQAAAAKATIEERPARLRGACIVHTDEGGGGPPVRRDPPAATAPAWPAPVPDGEECAPPCSPGYRCTNKVCAPQCNPPCAAGHACGPDRVCRPVTPG